MKRNGQIICVDYNEILRQYEYNKSTID